MADTVLWRASDEDRQEVLVALSYHYGKGRLTADEYEGRCGEVFDAQHADALAHALRELPPLPVSPMIRPATVAIAGVLNTAAVSWWAVGGAGWTFLPRFSLGVTAGVAVIAAIHDHLRPRG
jgi:hypothetical protein